MNDPAAGGGVIPDIVVHDADTVRFHFEEDPQEVMALESHGSLPQGAEDGAMPVWRMPSGVQVMTHESFTHPYSPSGFEVHGSKGSLISRNVMTQRARGEITLIIASGSREVIFETHGLCDRALGLFADTLNGKGAPSATAVDGVKSLAVAEAVKKAAVRGRAVTVDYHGV
ncbi:Gfo/Idh/MocA family protein [Cribrihabitans neustonicus]|uniref:Gfo/Idh/MocA family protein n=1 Tax=Cribrihabitans neustonicus TaxID=1429085 RepID=UPI003B59FA14